jgi:hypothetical protein
MGMDAFDEIQAEDYYTQEDEVKIKFGKTRIMAHLGSSYISDEGHVSMNIIVTPEVYEKINATVYAENSPVEFKSMQIDNHHFVFNTL